MAKKHKKSKAKPTSSPPTPSRESVVHRWVTTVIMPVVRFAVQLWIARHGGG